MLQQLFSLKIQEVSQENVEMSAFDETPVQYARVVGEGFFKKNVAHDFEVQRKVMRLVGVFK
jgi:hypothetical protein